MKNTYINNTTQTGLGASGLRIQGNNKKSLFTNGSILEALVENKKDGMTALRTKDGRMAFELPSSQVSGETGDILAFEVVSHVGDKLTLKQINDNQKKTESFTKTLSKKADVTAFKELMEQSEFKDKDIETLDYGAMAENARDMRVLERQALMKIRRQMNTAADNAGTAVVRAMAAAGVNVNKLELGTLSSMMTEIRKDPLLPAEDIDIAGQGAADMASFLEQAGLSPTDSNIIALETVSKIIDWIMEMDENMILAYLKLEDSQYANDIDKTIGGVYKYASAKPKTDDKSDNHININSDEIKRVFEREGILATPEHYAAAQAFIRAGVDLTRENMGIFDYLTNMDDSAKHELIKRAVLAMREGKAPLSASILPDEQTGNGFSRQDYEDLRLEVNIIKPEHIDLALTQNQPLTIRGLAWIAENAVVATAVTDASAAATARANLLEIGVMLTYEAANRLYAKGIRIDAVTLSDAVAALREEERDSFAANLRAFGGEDSQENLNTVRDAVEAARIMGQAPAGTYGDIVTSRVAFSMRGVSQNIANRLMSGEEAAAGYAAFEASPRARYNDRLRDAEEQFGRLLENLEIPATNQTIRAARILSANQIEINYENLLTIKVVDAKLAEINNRLHPLVAASMVADGLNPLDMTVDDVLAYIDGFGDVYGYNNADVLAEQIHALDKAKTLDSETRKAIIAIYKTLRFIDNNNGAGIGAAVASGGSVTLGRLMDMASGFKKPINTLIGEDREQRRRTGAAAKLRSILDNVKPKDSDGDFYGKKLVQSLTINAAPEALAEVFKNNDNSYETELETLAEKLADYSLENNNRRFDEAVKQASDDAAALENIKAAAVKELFDSGIPAIVPNILAYGRQRTGKNDNSILEINDNQSIDLSEIVDDVSLEKLGETGFEGYLEAIYQEIAGETENPDNQMTDADAVLRAMRLRCAVLNAQNGYYLPVKINGKITDVDIYLSRDDAELEQMENIDMILSLTVGRNHFAANISLRNRRAEAILAVNGVDSGRGGLLGNLITEAVTNEVKPVASHRAIRAGKLPERLHTAASVALRFIENIIKTEKETLQ